MIRFKGRYDDLKWGAHNYSVTRTQKETLDGLWYMMRGLPRTNPLHGTIPEGYFCSQRLDNGAVVIGLHGHSVSVGRNGRVVGNKVYFEDVSLIPSSVPRR